MNLPSWLSCATSGAITDAEFDSQKAKLLS